MASGQFNVDVVHIIKENVRFDDDNYVINTNQKAIFNFFNKIKVLTTDSIEQQILIFVKDKMKCKNNFYNKEIEEYSTTALFSTVKSYFEDEVVNWSDEEVEDSTNVVKSYGYNAEDLDNEGKQIGVTANIVDPKDSEEVNEEQKVEEP